MSDPIAQPVDSEPVTEHSPELTTQVVEQPAAPTTPHAAEPQTLEASAVEPQTLEASAVEPVPEETSVCEASPLPDASEAVDEQPKSREDRPAGAIVSPEPRKCQAKLPTKLELGNMAWAKKFLQRSTSGDSGAYILCS